MIFSQLIIKIKIYVRNVGYIEKMKGYDDKYKIRVGNYRIGITIDKKAKVIICQRIAHRREIYRVFP